MDSIADGCPYVTTSVKGLYMTDRKQSTEIILRSDDKLTVWVGEKDQMYFGAYQAPTRFSSQDAEVCITIHPTEVQAIIETLQAYGARSALLIDGSK